jgi:hypothetical protein
MCRFLTFSAIAASVLLAAAAVCIPPQSAAVGQETKPKPTSGSKNTPKSSKKKPSGSTQALDAKADQLQTQFTTEAEQLASQYFDAGQMEKAKTLLKSVLTLNPEAPGIQDKLKKIEDTIITANDFEVEINPTRGWESANALVFAERPIRFQVEGTYRFAVTTTVGPSGFADKDATKDMVSGLPCGALIGVILVKDKPGKPFLIGDGCDYTPKESGMLFLRVNSPADNKHIGKLKVAISGYVKSQ